MFELCPTCNKPLVNEENLTRLRALVISGGVAAGLLGGIVGCVALPLIGFGSSGVVAGSAAATWQSSIGAVAAGSLFATLQSLGATGVGTLLFGTVGTVASGGGALYLLHTIAERLGWCECRRNH